METTPGPDPFDTTPDPMDLSSGTPEPAAINLGNPDVQIEDIFV